MTAPFRNDDIAPFIAMATAEGWICDEWELKFLLQAFPQGCLVKRDGNEAVGYVTSVRHDESGWIGNLLVSPQHRRRGIGMELMRGAIDALLCAGVQTIWLTASAKGAYLYRKLGFVTIDSINRWVGEGSAAPKLFSAAPIDRKVIAEVDAYGWGDRREALLQVTSSRGRVFCGECSFLCTQHWEGGMQVGPWGALGDEQGAALFELALGSTGEAVFLDVPAGNVAAASLLTRKGFSIRGNNSLMYLGVVPAYHPQSVFALASMGSMG
ncbi:GNAT family N-acetyltransferase [Geomonas oryzae]|uniref:GNAT family N-acetyltransferase n=1 Tax=Geomonas oryzae TaxID=2364273 RepID=UPI00100B0560|nr:GNAT family N-acetyltransferase [Geomonas oryzae]